MNPLHSISRGRTPRCLRLSLILLPAAMTSLACESTNPNTTSSSSSDGGANVRTGADGGGDASANDTTVTEDAGAKCNTLSQLGGPTKVIGATYPSATEGGTLADGTYVLVGEKAYVAPGGGGQGDVLGDGMASATIEVKGTTLQVVLDSATYGEQRATYTMTPYPKSFGLKRTCLYLADGEDAGAMPLVSLTGINYNAQPTQLTLVKPDDSVSFTEWTFAKQ